MVGSDTTAPLQENPRKGQNVNFIEISNQPLIAVTNSCAKIFRAVLHAAATSPNRPAHLFARVSAEIDWHARHLKDLPAFLAARAPNVQVSFLATNDRTLSVLAELGLPGFVCSPSAFVDEFEMYPVLPQRKSWDAIYNARFISVKRHNLASDVPSVALIGAPWGVSQTDLAGIRAAIPHAQFLNFDAAQTYRNLDRRAVREAQNRARVGLILSETEGANLATIEYLLCGVPVVSTPPRGGRELFLPPSVCEIAEPNPNAVAGAVRRLIARNLDALLVRETALTLMRPHRDVFWREVAAAFKALGGETPPLAPRKLPYALLSYRPLPDYGF